MGKKPGVKAAGSFAGRAGMSPGSAHKHEKKKTNAKPTDLDTQEIPFKLREIMKSRIEMNKPKQKKKRKPVQNEELQTDIPVPKFKRKNHESVGAFLSRMNRETQHVVFLTKNQLDRQPEMELDDKGELPKKEDEEEEVEVKVTKKQKSEKKKEFDRRCLDKFVRKREEKKEARLEEEIFQDKVMFGEVAMEPPSLTAKPRKSATKTKPGEKQLFLTKLFDKSSSSVNSPPPPISMARKRMVEEERERVVNAYRELKKRKQKQAADSKGSRSHHR